MRIKPILMLLALAGGLACEKPPTGPVPLPKQGAYRILAMGDSYTIGENVPADKRWPVQLAYLLRERGVDAAAPDIIAKTGWTTAELATAVDQIQPKGPYSLVTLLIGVNDQFRGYGTPESQVMFSSLLEHAVKSADGKPERVLVLSVPDWSVTQFAEKYDRPKVAGEIDAMNQWERQLAEGRGARFLDITSASRQASTQPGMIAIDKLHPSSAQYAEWAAIVDRFLQQPPVK